MSSIGSKARLKVGKTGKRRELGENLFEGSLLEIYMHKLPRLEMCRGISCSENFTVPLFI